MLFSWYTGKSGSRGDSFKVTCLLSRVDTVGVQPTHMLSFSPPCGRLCEAGTQTRASKYVGAYFPTHAHTKLSHGTLCLLFSHSVVSDSLWPHGLQHATLPCPSPTPRACSHSCPSSQWCHPTISSSVIPFSSCFQSFPAPGSFPMSQFFASGGQSIGASASAAVFPMNIQDQFLLGWTGSISLLSKGLSRVFSSISSSALSRLHGLFAQFSSFAYREHDLLKSFSCFA